MPRRNISSHYRNQTGFGRTLSAHSPLKARVDQRCQLCGQPLDAYHASSSCDSELQKRLDAEAMARKRGRT